MPDVIPVILFGTTMEKIGKFLIGFGISSLWAIVPVWYLKVKRMMKVCQIYSNYKMFIISWSLSV